jgi:hypothetical protein
MRSTTERVVDCCGYEEVRRTSLVGTEETVNRVGGLSVCWGGVDALAQMQDRRHCKEATLAAIDLAKEPCNSGFLVNGLEFSRTTTPSGITIVGRANREQSALSRLQVSFNKL